MKYNISNLDKFVNLNAESLKALVNETLNNETNMIEDKLKELIGPYVSIELIENKQTFQIRDILKDKGYILTVNSDMAGKDEYCICEHLTGNKDYFIVESNVDLKEYKAWISISDIIRGI